MLEGKWGERGAWGCGVRARGGAGVQGCMAAHTGVKMGSRMRCKDAHSGAKMGFTEACMGAGMGWVHECEHWMHG